MSAGRGLATDEPALPGGSAGRAKGNLKAASSSRERSYDMADKLPKAVPSASYSAGSADILINSSEAGKHVSVLKGRGQKSMKNGSTMHTCQSGGSTASHHSSRHQPALHCIGCIRRPVGPLGLQACTGCILRLPLLVSFGAPVPVHMRTWQYPYTRLSTMSCAGAQFAQT